LSQLSFINSNEDALSSTQKPLEKLTKSKTLPKLAKHINLDEIDITDERYQLKFKRRLEESISNKQLKSGTIDK